MTFYIMLCLAAAFTCGHAAKALFSVDWNGIRHALSAVLWFVVMVALFVGHIL